MPCFSYYLENNNELLFPNSITTGSTPSGIVNTALKMNAEKKIQSLAQELKCKDAEIRSLQEAIKMMPEFAKIEGDVCFRTPGQKKAVLVQSFKPETISDRRRQIEDLCRDLVLNNDHISKMEQR